MTDYSAKIAALEDAAGSGELTIKDGAREVTYRSMKELLAALEYFRARQALSGSTTRYATTLYGEGCD